MPVNMKNMIAETFFGMTKEKNIDKITVKELVERCQISRQTFYYHFQDIWEVLEWSMDRVFQEALDRTLEAETPEAGIEVFVSMAVERHGMIERLLNSQRREHVEQLFVHGVETYLRKLMQYKAPDTGLSYSDTEVALHFYSYGIVGLMMDYCSDRNLNVEEFSRQICKLFFKGIEPVK